MPEDLETTVYMGTPQRFESDGGNPKEIETLLADYMGANQPRVHTTFDGAADDVQMASSSLEDSEAWVLAFVYGTTPEQHSRICTSTLPTESKGYVHELRLRKIQIETTDLAEKAAQLEFGAENRNLDALWLPSDEQTVSGSCLRILGNRNLLGEFAYVGTTTVLARSRRRR